MTCVIISSCGPNRAPTLVLHVHQYTLYAQCEKGTTDIVLLCKSLIVVRAKSLTGAPFPTTSMDVFLQDYDEILLLCR